MSSLTRRSFVLAAGLGVASLLSPAEAVAEPVEMVGRSAISGAPVTGLVTVAGATYAYYKGVKLVGRRSSLFGGTRFFKDGDGAMAEAEAWSDASGAHWSDADGLMVTGDEVLHDDGTWTRYDDAGDMVTGWYAAEDGSRAFYDAADGHRLSGEAYVPASNDEGAEHRWFVFDEETGDVLTGWQDLEDGRHVYHDPETGARLFGWQDVDGGSVHLDEETGDELAFWVKGEGGSTHSHDAVATAQLAIRVVSRAAPEEPLYSGGGDHAFDYTDDERTQEFIRVMEEYTAKYANDGTSGNTALASCTQAVGHVVRATVDPDIRMMSPEDLRLYCEASERWERVGWVDGNDWESMEELCLPGDVLCNPSDCHTVLYVGNDLVREAYPDCNAIVFEAAYGTGFYPYLSEPGHGHNDYGCYEKYDYDVYRYTGVTGETVHPYRDVWRMLAGAEEE